MKTITIRGVEPEVAEKLKETAQKQGKSMKQIIIKQVSSLCNLPFPDGCIVVIQCLSEAAKQRKLGV